MVRHQAGILAGPGSGLWIGEEPRSTQFWRSDGYGPHDEDSLEESVRLRTLSPLYSSACIGTRQAPNLHFVDRGTSGSLAHAQS